jgi:hypothetical protein
MKLNNGMNGGGRFASFFTSMAEVLAEFSNVLIDEAGVKYRAHACGSEMPDGTWHGWLEFIPLDGAPPIRSGRETTQPNRVDAVYWANGLTQVYLEGSLQRALKPLKRRVVVPDAPAFQEPAPRSQKLPGRRATDKTS